MPRRILHVVSNVAHYDDPAEPTGLWLSELSHAWEVFAQRGYAQHLVSPLGGHSPLEPRSLKWPKRDATARAWLADAARMALLSNTAAPDAVDAQDFDAIYFTGGHAVMLTGSRPARHLLAPCVTTVCAPSSGRLMLTARPGICRATISVPATSS
jgi:putative intracellular protease/amidase